MMYVWWIMERLYSLQLLYALKRGDCTCAFGRRNKFPSYLQIRSPHALLSRIGHRFPQTFLANHRHCSELSFVALFNSTFRSSIPNPQKSTTQWHQSLDQPSTARWLQLLDLASLSASPMLPSRDPSQSPPLVSKPPLHLYPLTNH